MGSTTLQELMDETKSPEEQPETRRDAARCQPRLEQIDPRDIPQPARQLLVHEHDMTSTLQGFFRDEIHLRVLNQQRTSKVYTREVVLCLDRDDRPVEYGTIDVHYMLLPKAARADIERAHRPFGAILKDYRVAYRCRPGPYFRVHADEGVHKALRLQSQPVLFGRRNRLLTEDGALLADVLEVLTALTRRDGSA